MLLFLILNFILLILAFFFIIILYLRQSSLQGIEKKQAALIKEMEDLLATYTLEMKEENAVFLEKIRENGTAQKENRSLKKQAEFPDEKRTLINHPHIDVQIGEENPTNLLPKYDNSKVDTQTLVSDAKTITNTKQKPEELQNISIHDESIHSVLTNAIELQNKGFTIENIAKQLNKGKTEIELLLKFRQN